MSLQASLVGIAALPFLAAFFVAVVFYSLYRFTAMNNTPFKTMKAIYVYLAALIGLGIVAVGLYGFLGHLIEVLLTDTAFDAGFLIVPFTKIIVGLFVMLPHWAIGHHFHMKEHKRR